MKQHLEALRNAQGEAPRKAKGFWETGAWAHIGMSLPEERAQWEMAAGWVPPGSWGTAELSPGHRGLDSPLPRQSLCSPWAEAPARRGYELPSGWSLPGAPMGASARLTPGARPPGLPRGLRLWPRFPQPYCVVAAPVTPRAPQPRAAGPPLPPPRPPSPPRTERTTAPSPAPRHLRGGRQHLQKGHGPGSSHHLPT